METERLIIDQIKETDKEDYFNNISHDKRVLETFICRYADSLEEFDFSSYPGRQDLLGSGIKGTQRRRSRGFWNYCSGRKECERYMHLSSPGMTPPAVLWRNVV